MSRSLMGARFGVVIRCTVLTEGTVMRRLAFAAVVFGYSAFALLSARSPSSQAAAHRVGSEACQECHESEYREFRAGGHGRAEADSTVLPDRIDCETCHGPGSLHVEADGDESDPRFATLRNFETMPADQANGACLTCHNTGEQFYWAHSSHARNDVACVKCHSMHEAKDPAHAAL